MVGSSLSRPLFVTALLLAASGSAHSKLPSSGLELDEHATFSDASAEEVANRLSFDFLSKPTEDDEALGGSREEGSRGYGDSSVELHKGWRHQAKWQEKSGYYVVPASVIPRCSGWSIFVDSSRFDAIVCGTLVDLMETLKS